MQSRLGSDKISANCALLHRWFNKMKVHKFPFNVNEIPLNGIYVLFEKGELAHGTNRIVRIGTHTGKDQLRSRLEQHFVNENKDRSIFRRNVGRCILNKTKDPFLKDWEMDLTTREAKDKLSKGMDFEKLTKVEKMVSDYMQENFSFVVFEVDKKDKRLGLESKMISTVSLCDECVPSKDWLGRFSPKEKVRESGLWLVNELYKTPMSEKDMDELKRTINAED
ncbi:MAG: hypothetical protein M1504_04160 [Candidatus Marsarchaeota archaeon]|nr:hypothetical protein [Candidatus Marsarchaeota archaeon]